MQFDNLNICVNEIIPVDWLEKTPARVYRDTGIVLINAKIWDKLSLPAKKFILLHEEGHFQLQTIDELQADAYAFKKYVGSEKMSLKNTINLIAETLSIDKNPAHQLRFKNIADKVLDYDFSNFGNLEALKLMTMNKDFIFNKLVEFLKSKGLTTIDGLTTEQKQQLAEEFLLKDFYKYIKGANQISNYNIEQLNKIVIDSIADANVYGQYGSYGNTGIVSPSDDQLYPLDCIEETFITLGLDVNKPEIAPKATEIADKLMLSTPAKDTPAQATSTQDKTAIDPTKPIVKKDYTVIIVLIIVAIVGVFYYFSNKKNNNW